MFTTEEVRFLSREHAVAGLREFPEIDLATLVGDKDRSLRCIQSILERRAKKLGKTFKDFQGVAPIPDDLDTKIQSQKLW